jgi:Zn ribbon nucleic-acid-binding protein
LTEKKWPMRTQQCPVCGALDAFIDTFRDGDEYYVECVNCHVYRASRRAFRLFQYLRSKADRESLGRLGGLAARLRARGRGPAAQLEYETWETFGTARASQHPE